MTLQDITHQARALIMQTKNTGKGLSTVNAELGTLFTQAVNAGINTWKIHHLFKDLIKEVQMVNDMTGSAYTYSVNNSNEKKTFMNISSNIPNQLKRVAEIGTKIETSLVKLKNWLPMESAVNLHCELVALRGDIERYGNSYGTQDQFYSAMLKIVNDSLAAVNDRSYMRCI